ncbi:MAG: RNA methyltransferase [Asgard group archaeon]|nr:RNA methyltransferase [Asgard group archaeon]
MTIKIVLVEPSVPGNIGAAARVMMNFGFQELVLINPQTELTSETYRFAKNAQEMIDKIQIFDTLEECVKDIPYVIGTTGRIVTDGGSTGARTAVSSTDPSLKNVLEFQDDIAILFGREDSGLTNDEINLCDMTIYVPTSDDYRSLNLAQAIAIICYQLSALKTTIRKTHYRSAKKEEKEQLIEWFAKAVSVLGIKDYKSDHLVRRFRNIIGRAFVSGKEAVSLLGVFSRTYNQIKDINEDTK